MQSLNGWVFISQGGAISIIVAIILVAMSVMSWYLIGLKAWKSWQAKQLVGTYIRQFWQKASLNEALREAHPQSPAYQLAMTAIDSTQHHQQHASQSLAASYTQDEFIARQLRRSLGHTQSQLEHGLTVLASVGSVAPFVGLFGTVWGIFHALTAIGQSGSATIDKVAGPVGEALIMTAIGLAVAIPAVLAYNAYVKTNRKTMAELENFAQDLYTLLTTGAPLLIGTVTKSAKVTDIQTKLNQAKV